MGMTVGELRYAIVRVCGAPSRELAALDALIAQVGRAEHEPPVARRSDPVARDMTSWRDRD